MKNYKAVVFDMDGTLLDTLDDLHISLNYALNACGHGGRTKEEVQSFIGDGIDVLIARAMPESTEKKSFFATLSPIKCGDLTGSPITPVESGDFIETSNNPKTEKEQIAEFIEQCKKVGEVFRAYYIEHGEDNTKPYDGIIELLRALKASGIKTAVVSNKVQEAVEGLSKKLFAGLIDVAVGDRAGVRLKPAPDMLLSALATLGIGRDEAVFVGDGDTDIEASARAGLDCISVCYGYRSEEFLRAHGGKTFAHDAYELANLLNVNI